MQKDEREERLQLAVFQLALHGKSFRDEPSDGDDQPLQASLLLELAGRRSWK